MTADVTRPLTGETLVWVAVCRLGELDPERGAAALVHGSQIALFRLLDDSVVAVQQRDPYSGAHVMSRGLVGTRGDDVSTVASPMYKQVFDLRDGRCLDPVGEEPIDLCTFDVLVRDEVVHVAVPAGDLAP